MPGGGGGGYFPQIKSVDSGQSTRMEQCLTEEVKEVAEITAKGGVKAEGCVSVEQWGTIEIPAN